MHIVKNEINKKSIMKYIAGRNFEFHKGARRPINAKLKNCEDDLMIGGVRILKCSIILVIEREGVISDGIIKVQKNIWLKDFVSKQKIKKIVNGIK